MKTQKGNAALQAAFELYEGIEADYQRALEATGVTFAPYDGERARTRALVDELRAAGAFVRNGGASVVLGSMSCACVACTGSCVSRSFALTNNCHRDCYFCFNPNQEEFAYYCEHPFPWRKQLDDLAAEMRGADAPACIALTGGEPLLMPEEACAFFARARELFGSVHLRIYTSGDLLDEALLARLAQAGLDEIRFSVKQDDPRSVQEKVLANMVLAKKHVPTVMVEMPVIPGTEAYMQDLLRRLDEIGVDGVNLLEFTYPMWNWPVYESMGLTLKNPPFHVFFDYSYAGTLAVQDSEELCLQLMLWAHGEGLRLGLHYCSLENKHRAQVRNITEPYALVNACYAFDYGDFFLKTALVFGTDRTPVRLALRKLGCRDFIEDEASDSTSFHPRWLQAASSVRTATGACAQACISYNIAVDQGKDVHMRELKVERAAVAPVVQLHDDESQAPILKMK